MYCYVSVYNFACRDTHPDAVPDEERANDQNWNSGIKFNLNVGREFTIGGGIWFQMHV